MSHFNLLISENWPGFISTLEIHVTSDFLPLSKQLWAVPSPSTPCHCSDMTKHQGITAPTPQAFCRWSISLLHTMFGPGEEEVVCFLGPYLAWLGTQRRFLPHMVLKSHRWDLPPHRKRRVYQCRGASSTVLCVSVKRWSIEVVTNCLWGNKQSTCSLFGPFESL